MAGRPRPRADTGLASSPCPRADDPASNPHPNNLLVLRALCVSSCFGARPAREVLTPSRAGQLLTMEDRVAVG